MNEDESGNQAGMDFMICQLSKWYALLMLLRRLLRAFSAGLFSVTFA
jgi:hypothetical protein